LLAGPVVKRGGSGLLGEIVVGMVSIFANTTIEAVILPLLQRLIRRE